MSLFLRSLAVVFVLALGTMLTGRALCAALDLRAFRRRSLENFIVAAFLGTGLWLLLFGWGSHVGLPAPRIVPLVGACGVILVLASALRRRLDWLLPRPRFWEWLNASIPCAIALVLTFLPFLLGNGFAIHNEPFPYISMSEWLQTHGFGTTCPDTPEQPITALVQCYQRTNLRMGTTFLLALTQVLFPTYRAMEVFLPVEAWGFLLNLGGIFLFCRWCFRVSGFYASVAVYAAAVTCNPFYFAVVYGFLPQVYGTAFLMCLLVLMSRARSRIHWRREMSLSVGLVAASLISVYSEMAPLMAVLGGSWFFMSLYRARKGNQWLRLLGFAGLSLLAMSALANIELVRTARMLPGQLRAVVGGHWAWPRQVFWAFAMGTHPWVFGSWGPDQAWTRARAAGTLAATGLFLLGICRPSVHKRGTLMLVVLGLLGCLGAYFMFVARNPWTGGVGQTWSLLKVTKWAFPLVLVVQVSGLQFLTRRWPWARALIVLFGLLVMVRSVPYHHRNAMISTGTLRWILTAEKPFKAIRQLGQRLDELRSQRLYFVHEAEGVFPRCLVGYFLYPRTFVNDWKNSWLASQAEIPPALLHGEGKTTYFMCGQPPFDTPQECLPGGFSVLDPAGPVVFKVTNPVRALEQAADAGKFFWQGPEETKLELWSPRAGNALLTFRAQGQPGLPATTLRHLQFKLPDGSKKELSLCEASEETLSFPIPEGISRLVVSYPDQPTSDSLPNGGVRNGLVRLMHLHLTLVQDSARGELISSR
jgi:hypothetical protein